MPPAVSVQGLAKRYGDTVAVADVSFEVAEGEIFGLLGPNGSGKTTTVECLQGLRRPNAGDLRVFGRDPVTEPRAVRPLLGSQLQDSALPERLKVWEALRLFSVIDRSRASWEEHLEDWGLADRRDASFGDLSGGQRQRLFVALALLAGPRLVVLDEMTTGLDPAARRVAWDLVGAVRERGTTVILVTHFMDEAERLCDRLAVLARGRVVASGSVGELVASARRPSVVRFTTAAGRDLEFLDRVTGVDQVRTSAGGHVEVTGTGPLLARVGHALVERGLEPLDLQVERATLEDVYLAVTDGGSPAAGAAEDR
jgi:ABC-2 type transport system ATP-binding protein